MSEIIYKIIELEKELLDLKPKTKIDFNEVFERHEVAEEDKLEFYNYLRERLRGYIRVDENFKNNVVEKPYDVIYVKNEKYTPEPTAVNKTAIQKVIDVLENGEPYKVHPRNVQNEIITMGYVEYNDTVLKLFRYMPFYEKDYTKNIEKIAKEDIEALKIEEVKQYITYIYRKEKFIQGIIQEYIDNGILLKLLKRFLEIC